MRIKDTLRLGWQGAKMARHALHDLTRYFKAAASEARTLDDAQLQARLLQKAHSIEKGLALPDVRPGFGKAALLELRQLLDIAQQRGLSPEAPALLSARHAVGAYLALHAAKGWSLPDDLLFATNLPAAHHAPQWGGWLEQEAASTRAAAQGNFESLVNARRSTRMFSRERPSLDTLQSAISLASRSPSVCNRQGGRARVVFAEELLQRILTLQGGNRGFTQEIPCVLVVTCYVGLFRGARERNQCWIDGGLFAMSLLYALTYQGLASCPLNWSADVSQDRALRQLLQLPDDEVVIMLVAVGHWRDHYKVATSARLGIDTVMPRVYA
ncbi:MAG: hypothetical protein RLZZ182_1146 [Pseudomonadota bacterium]